MNEMKYLKSGELVLCLEVLFIGELGEGGKMNWNCL
jgi:hypothetical protein